MIFKYNQETSSIGLNRDFSSQFTTTYVPQKAYSEALPIITEYNRLVAEGGTLAEKFASEQTDAGMRSYLTNLKDGNAELPKYSAHIKGLNANYKAMTVSARATGVAVKALNVAISMGAAMLLSWGLSALVTELDNWISAGDRAIETADDLTTAWEKSKNSLAETKSYIDSNADDYNRLAKGVNNLGENVALSADEYAKYNEIANKIAANFPDMVSGYTKEGTAIIKNRGNVELLTESYKNLEAAASQAIIAQSSSVLAGYGASIGNQSGFKGFLDATQGKPKIAQAIKEVEDIISSVGGREPLINENLADRFKSGGAFGWVNNLSDALGVSINSTQDIIDNLDKVRAYRTKLIADMNAETEKIKPIIPAFLGANSDYAAMTSESKSLIDRAVSMLGTQFYTSFVNSEDGSFDEVSMYAWVEKNFVDPLKSMDGKEIETSLGSMFSLEDAFQNGKISAKEYISELRKIENYVTAEAPQLTEYLGKSLDFGFGRGDNSLDVMMNNVKDKLLDGYDDMVETLTLPELQIAFSLPDNGQLTWDGLKKQITESQTASAQTIEALEGSLKPLTEMYSTLNSAISEQAESGSMSYETYNKLIAANADFANAISVVDGQLKIDADKAYEAADAHTKLQESLAKAAQAAKQSEYDEVANNLEEVNDKLKEMDELGYQNSLYDSLLNQKDALESQQDALGKQLQQYQSITSQIKGMTSAYYKYLQAKQTPDQGEEYDQFTGAKEVVKEGRKSGKTGTDDFQSSVDLILGGSSEGLSSKDKKARYKKAEQKYNRYFTENKTGANNFVKDLLGGGFATKDGKTVTLGEDVTGEQIAEKLGVSLDAVKALFGEMEEYDWEVEWEKLFPSDSETTGEEQSSQVQTATDTLKTDVETYEQTVDDSVKKIEDANQRLNDALEGKTPGKPTGDGSPPESSVENRKNEGLETPSTSTPTSNVYATKTINLLLHIVEGEIERVTAEVNGITGEATVTANDDDAQAVLTQLGIDLTSIPTGTVKLSLTDESGAAQSVTSMKDALALINEGASANVTITLPPDTTQEDLKNLNNYLAFLPPEVQSKINVDYSAVSPAVASANTELGNVEDEEAIIDADTKYLSGDVDRANELLGGVESPVADITADASTVPNTVAAANLETSKLKDRTITITTVHESGGGDGGHGADTGGTTGTSTFGGGSSSGSGGGRTSKSEPAELINTDNIEEAVTQLTFFEALWARIQAWLGGNEYVVPDIVSPTAQTELTTAQDQLDGLASTQIPDKTISLDDTQARADLQAFEDRADDTVEKKINVTYSGAEGKFAKGTKNSPKGTVLVDEKGAELIEHSDGTFEMGTNEGPRFTAVDKGATIHTAEETKKILRRGLSPKSTTGNRYATGGEWDFGGGSGNQNTSSKKKNTKKVNWKKYVDKLFDWIEVRLERLQSATKNWMREVERAIGYIEKNKAIDEAIASQQEQIEALSAAYDRYMEQAEQIRKKTGLKDSTIEKIQNGTIDIGSYSKEDQARIQAYMEWWEKAQGVKDEIEDLKDEQRELANQKIDNIANQYDDLAESIQNARENAQSAIDVKVSRGEEVTESDYAPAITAQEQLIENLRQKQEAMIAEFNAQVQSGTLVEGSDAWNEYRSQIEALDSEINNATVDLEELNDASENIVVTNLGYMLSALQTTQASIQQTLDLIEAQGRTATADSYASLIDNGMAQIANLERQNAALREQQQNLDENSEKYQELEEQINSNLASINDIKVSQEQWNDSITDLKIAEIQKARDELEKTNATYQRQLDLQQAQEDLERAKTQRRVRTYVEGQGYVWQASEQDIQEKTRALEQKQHEETLAKMDEAIEALEELKAEDNVYEDQGTSPNASTASKDGFQRDTAGNDSYSTKASKGLPGAGLTPISLTDSLSLISDVALDRFAQFMPDMAHASQILAESLNSASIIPLVDRTKFEGLAPITIQSIVVHEASDANATVKAIADGLQVQMMKKSYK